VGLKLCPVLVRIEYGLGQNRTKVGLKQLKLLAPAQVGVRQNRTKVGLKPPTCGRCGSCAHGAKSNQGGIETKERSLTTPRLLPAKSNQGGIETVQPPPRVAFLSGQNRTKVGLKLARRLGSLCGGRVGKIEPRWD
jgi:hypothetical protein